MLQLHFPVDYTGRMGIFQMEANKQTNKREKNMEHTKRKEIGKERGRRNQHVRVIVIEVDAICLGRR